MIKRDNFEDTLLHFSIFKAKKKKETHTQKKIIKRGM
jgi:hypothetical protein